MEAVELLDLMLQGLAPGVTEAWDLQPNPEDPDFYEELFAIAQSLKWAVKDRIDTLRTERNPAAAAEKLQDYELALGLQFTTTAQYGSTAQRQGQIVGRFRETGGLTKFSLQTVMQAYLKYADPSQIQIIEPDRAALFGAHLYTFPAPFAPPASVKVTVADDSWVSDMGAQLFISMTVAGSGSSGIVQLRGPDGFIREWAVNDYRSLGIPSGGNTVFALWLCAPEFGPKLNAAGTAFDRHKIKGDWTLTVKNMDTVDLAGLFVEGVGRNSAGQDGLGAALFEWGVLAESAKLGAGADLLGAAAAIERMNHAHLRGVLLLDGALVTSIAAIPDDPNAIPDASIPG